MVFEFTKLCSCKNSLPLISELQVSHQINGVFMDIFQGVLENVSDKVCRVHSTGTQHWHTVGIKKQQQVLGKEHLLSPLLELLLHSHHNSGICLGGRTHSNWLLGAAEFHVLSLCLFSQLEGFLCSLPGLHQTGPVRPDLVQADWSFSASLSITY